ncbi:MAG TPA: hypothetical protein VGO60_15595 [Iamia sp.]|nr:hypothetical protein [Iamia sp.]
MPEALGALSAPWWRAVESTVADGRGGPHDADFVVHEVGDGGESHMAWDGPVLRAWRPGPPDVAPHLVLARPAVVMIDDLLARAAPERTLRESTARLPGGPHDLDLIGLPAIGWWPWAGAETPWRLTWRLTCGDTPFGPAEIDLDIGFPFGWRHRAGAADRPDVAFELSHADVLRWTGGSTFLGAVLDLHAVTGDLTMLSAIDGVVGGQAEQMGVPHTGDLGVLARYGALRRTAAFAETADRVDSFTRAGS